MDVGRDCLIGIFVVKMAEKQDLSEKHEKEAEFCKYLFAFLIIHCSRLGCPLDEWRAVYKSKVHDNDKNVFCKVNITDLVPTLLGAYFANTARPPVATRWCF